MGDLDLRMIGEWSSDQTLALLAGLTQLYWVLGLLIYSLKFLSPEFDRCTSYGKLGPDSVRAVSHVFAWRAFYLFGAVWNLLVIIFEIFMDRYYHVPLGRSIIFSLLLQIQVTRRAYECFFVHKFSPHR